MREKLKKYGVLTLFLLAKSLVLLKNAAARIRLPFARRAIKTSGAFLLYILLWALSPLYRQSRLLKKRIFDFISAEHSRFLRSFSHHYALHLFMALIAIITVVSNLTARQADAENFGSGNLISSLVQTDEELLFNEGLIVPEITQQPEPTEDKKLAADYAARTFLNYTGETIFQPYLPSTEDSVAPRQNIEEYIVAEGNTLAGIAVSFHLQLNTILLANN